MNSLGNLIYIFSTVLLLSVLLSGCGGGDDETYSQDSIDLNSVDLNNDNVADIRYEYDEQGYYQLMDRNFDGKMDDSSRYTLEHYLVSSKSDDDFDGIFETQVVYKNSLVAFVLVDTNNNEFVDLVFEYENSLMSSAEKYYNAEGGNSSARIGKVFYKFGYPTSQEMLTLTEMSEEEFSKKSHILAQKVSSRGK